MPVRQYEILCTLRGGQKCYILWILNLGHNKYKGQTKCYLYFKSTNFYFLNKLRFTKHKGLKREKVQKQLLGSWALKGAQTQEEPGLFSILVSLPYLINSFCLEEL